ncbi:hypothetical protein WR25_20619 isoform D [Diploscapter pachys]|uniref:Uncharacterized protein n=1 Tax=Diploscapter pachys TaxID=2018661 RepID=A0A2A2KZN4_9BILA|nr:hypothetical protein WR25_20619 isoform D [Diploscapter pachys]
MSLLASLQTSSSTPWRGEKDGSYFHTDDIGKVEEERFQMSSQNITPDERRELIDIASAVERFGANPFLETTYESEPSYRAFLREKRASEGFIPEHDADLHESTLIDDDASDPENRRKSGQTFAGPVSDYCNRYEQNFAVYCIGDVDESHNNYAIISRFCPAYRQSCRSKSIVSQEKPESPFSRPEPSEEPRKMKSLNVGSGPGFSDSTFGSFATDADRLALKEGVASKKSGEHVSDHRKKKGRHHRRHKKIGDKRSPFIRDEFDLEEEDTNVYYRELQKRFPCKPDCDSRIFPHCTASCKCDYLYPHVQRFCNPPPMPLFLNTCRLWYNGCPKYEGYHYASQFVYSKAEKGKRLPAAINPYNIPNPSNVGVPALGRKKREAEMTPWGETHVEKEKNAAKANGVRIEDQSEIRRTSQKIEDHSSSHIMAKGLPIPPEISKEDRERLESEKEEKRQHQRGILHDRLDEVKYKLSRRADETQINSEPRSNPTKGNGKYRELWRTLKAVNAMTAGDLINHQESLADLHKGKNPSAKAFQGVIPVVPSDASYGANSGSDDNTFHKFDALTDSRGILHRPRSSSPFSKPGLWEANPDDPHNRDHANKYWYRPESVGVDWLNGQMTWGAHWAVPAAGVGGTDGFSALHFPSVGTFLNIPDDYD